MPRTVEGQRQARGFVERAVDVPADLDRRLVHHARVGRTPYELLVQRALMREVQRLDNLESGDGHHRDGEGSGVPSPRGDRT